MEVLDEAVYQDWKDKNKGGYGGAIFDFAERWANLMEPKLANGLHIKDIADQLSNEADTEGITGFMYNAGVAVLTNCWVHGEELRKWHNGDYKGEGTVNTSIINLGGKN